MTKAEDEEKVLEDIFGSKVTIKNLRLQKCSLMYPACFNSQKIKAFLIVLKNSNTLCGFSPEFLTLGNLIYLKDSLDKRIRDRRYQNISCIVDFDSKNFRTAIREGIKGGYDWRKIIDESVIRDMYPEQALYLDCLVRLNEVHKEICKSSIDDIIK